MDPKRNLTDADVEAIAERIRQKIITEFYEDLGQGLWGYFKQLLIWGLFAIAAYGASKGMGFSISSILPSNPINKP